MLLLSTRENDPVRRVAPYVNQSIRYFRRIDPFENLASFGPGRFSTTRPARSLAYKRDVAARLAAATFKVVLAFVHGADSPRRDGGAEESGPASRRERPRYARRKRLDALAKL